MSLFGEDAASASEGWQRLAAGRLREPWGHVLGGGELE